MEVPREVLSYKRIGRSLNLYDLEWLSQYFKVIVDGELFDKEKEKNISTLNT
jgi:hypothetical protein